MFWGFFSFFRIDASLVRKQYNVYIVAVPMTVWQMVLDVGCPGDVENKLYESQEQIYEIY